MIPILYDKYEKAFTTMGIGTLDDCLSCEVTEQVNGVYELVLTYPKTGKWFSRLLNSWGVVAVTHDHTGDVQFFDIYRYDTTIAGSVTVYASHVSYRLNNIVVSPSTSQSSPAGVFSLWENGTGFITDPIVPFHFNDYTGQSGGTFDPQAPYNVRYALLNRSEETYTEGAGNTILDLWNGEYVFDNFSVNLYTKRGINRGVTIRYRNNMTEMQRTRDTGSIVSAVLPIFNDNGTVITYPIVSSPNTETDTAQWISGTPMTCNGEEMYFNAAIVNVAPVDFSDQFDHVPTVAEMRSCALSYMSKNSTWRAQDNISVSVADLYHSGAYNGKGYLQDFRVGDYVGVYYPEMGVADDNVEIVSGTYDVLREQFTKIELNMIRTTLAEVIIKEVNA